MKSHDRAMSLSRLGRQSYRIGTVAHFKGRSCPRKPKPGIVFAHGLWADSSWYSKVIPALRATGHVVASSQQSLDTPEGDVATLLRTAPTADLFSRNAKGTASRSKPSWYIVASDRTVHPKLQRFVANRTGATTYEVRSNHVSMLSQPSPAS